MTFEEFENWDISYKKELSKSEQLEQACQNLLSWKQPVVSPSYKELLDMARQSIFNDDIQVQAPLMHQGCRSFIPTTSEWIKALDENNGNREDAAKNYFNALLKNNG